jgi:Helix-turn-helix domain
VRRERPAAPASRVVVLTAGELEELIAGVLERANGQEPPKVWLSAEEVAAHLGVSAKTVQNLSGPNVEDPIPWHPLSAGGRKMFNRREVDEWLMKR